MKFEFDVETYYMSDFDWENADIELVSKEGDPFKAYVCKSKDLSQPFDPFYFVVFLDLERGEMFLNDSAFLRSGYIPNKTFSSFEEAREYVTKNMLKKETISKAISKRDQKMSSENLY